MALRTAPLVLAILASSPAIADSPGATPKSAWLDSKEEATAVRASIEVPRTAGTMFRLEVRDLGKDGIDLVAQYGTPDEKIFGTIFIYRPSLADSGLTFLATDEAIRRRLGASFKVISDRTISAGGVENAGRRLIYSGSEGGLRSALTIVQAGSWMVKFRVSGPGSRANEIAGNLDALVSGTIFGKGSEPLPAHIIQAETCGDLPPATDASLIKPQGSAAVAIALMATPRFRDEKGKAAADITGRVPDRLCLAESGSDGKIPLLTYRTSGSNSGGMFAPKMFQLYGDAGVIVEVTRPTKGSAELFALRHGLGRVTMYGGFSSEPNASQLQLIRNRSKELPIVAVVSDKPEGTGSNIDLNCDTFAEGCGNKK